MESEHSSTAIKLKKLITGGIVTIKMNYQQIQSRQIAEIIKFLGRTVKTEIE